MRTDKVKIFTKNKLGYIITLLITLVKMYEYDLIQIAFFIYFLDVLSQL